MKTMKKHIQDELKKQSKIEQNRETIKPTAINETLIQEYKIGYNRENAIFDDFSPTWELTHLSLSFKSKSNLNIC